jgi:hypothetical protein
MTLPPVARGYHRGRYHTDKPRRTLMFTYTGAPFSTFDYFSDQPWVLQEGYLDSLSPGGQAFFGAFAQTFGCVWCLCMVQITKNRFCLVLLLWIYSASNSTIMYDRVCRPRILAKQADEMEGSGEGRHPGFPNHLEQFYAQAAAVVEGASAKL